MASRFTTTAAAVLEQPPRLAAGLSRAVVKPVPKAPEPKNPTRTKPTRTTTSWQPLPLVCKRFGHPVPEGVDVGRLRDQQFVSPAEAVTTADTGSKLFDSAVAPFLPNKAPLDEPSELPARPPIDIFKAIFEVDEPRAAPIVASPAAAPVAAPVTAPTRDLFQDVFDTADPQRRDESPARRKKRKKKHHKDEPADKKKKKHKRRRRSSSADDAPPPQ